MRLARWMSAEHTKQRLEHQHKGPVVEPCKPQQGTGQGGWSEQERGLPGQKGAAFEEHGF